ncbi:MAG: helix-turn-helix transcriptional regulator [Elusimicrobia bacterium]|nr:helix-turn-helix transcriptional regulator [Elusimicrobiota bacterium]
MSQGPSFPRVAAEAMARRGLGLRELARRAGVDPSLLSKILAGKRPPPAGEETLARLADALDVERVALIVSAGRIPSTWSALWRDPALVRAVDRLAGGGVAAPDVAPSPAAPRARAPRPARAPSPPVSTSRGLAEELL